MKKYTGIILVLVSLLASQCFAQLVPDSVLIGRVKANRGHFAQWDHRATLKERVKAKGGDLNLNIVTLETPAKCDNCATQPPENDYRIRTATGNSDLIAVGTITDNISSLTANETFIFTDSQFKISEIWKGSVNPGVVTDGGNSQDITVTTPGGVAKIQGHTVTARLSNRVPLQVGHTYLLFLKYLPDSHSYKTVGGLIGFDLTGEGIECLYKGIPPPASGLSLNRSEYMAAIRSSIERQESEERSE